jgi:RNA polymerase sigma-70 factor (ECF subfamily)
VKTVNKENRLLQRVQNLDTEALAEVYDLYSPELFRYAVRLMNNEDLAEECVAETFNRFLNAVNNSGGPQRYLRAYLYRIAHNWVTDQYRRQVTPQQLEDIDLHQDPNSITSELVDEKIERETVRAALRYLTPDQRQVVVLKFLEGWSNAEVAESLDKPIGAVKSLQHRALGALRRILTDEGERYGLK